MKNSPEFDAIKEYLDDDIVKKFEEVVDGGFGKKYTINFLNSATSALTATNIQLIRVLREAFSRGFIVKK